MMLLKMRPQSHREVEVGTRMCTLISSPRDSRYPKIREPLKQVFNKRMRTENGRVKQNKREFPGAPASIGKRRIIGEDGSGAGAYL